MSIKSELCNFIKDIFQKNKLLSSYSFLINTFFLDGIFMMHLKQYVGQIDLDDIPTIKNVLETSLQIKLEECLQKMKSVNYTLILKNIFNIY